MAPTGFTPDELAELARDLVTIDATLSRTLVGIVKRGLRRQQVNAARMRVIALVNAIELELNALELEKMDQPKRRAPRKKKPAAAA